MTAATTGRHTWYQESVETLMIPLAADAIVYRGCMACIDADGYLVDADDAANYKFAGVVERDPDDPGASTIDNTGGSDGDKYAIVRQRGRYRFHLGLRTPSQDMLFAKVYVMDNQTVVVAGIDAVHNVRCGHITRLPADTLGRDPETDFSTDEVEIQLSGEPFDWGEDLTTTTTAQA